MALGEVPRDELQGLIAELREALTAHLRWHGNLVRTLVCRLPGDRRDANPDSHKECRFGQWYYGASTECLRGHPGFVAMGDAHQRMHHLGRLLLIAAEAGKPISTLEHDGFANALERLRLEISTLSRELEDSLFNHDSLTGAITRFGILPTLREQQELVKRHVLACYLAMMDVDNFKALNDTHGHAAGDRVLSAAVRYLIAHLRPYDKVFRYGGEEFLLCLPYAEAGAGQARIAQLGQGLAGLEIDVGGGAPVRISASFGVTLLDPEVPVETSIDRADKAMYAAKAAGRNCVRSWAPTM